MTATLPGCAVPPSELVGPPEAPVVVALGGISAHRHVTSTDDDRSPGWWEGFVGPGRTIDTTRWRVLGVDYVVQPHGATTTADQAHALAHVLDERGIASVRAVVGSSYGAMVALAFAALYPERVEHVVAISGGHRSHPMAQAIRTVQRRIVALGVATGRRRECVALARALGITTYRTAEEFVERFDTAPTRRGERARFEVEDYLDAAGERFANAFSAERYVALSESLDLHDVDPATIRTPTTVIGVDSDALVPTWQLRELRETLGGPASLHLLSSRYGHDAFLKEQGTIGPILTQALGAGVSHVD